MENKVIPLDGVPGRSIDLTYSINNTTYFVRTAGMRDDVRLVVRLDDRGNIFSSLEGIDPKV